MFSAKQEKQEETFGRACAQNCYYRSKRVEKREIK